MQATTSGEDDLESAHIPVTSITSTIPSTDPDPLTSLYPTQYMMVLRSQRLLVCAREEFGRKSMPDAEPVYMSAKTPLQLEGKGRDNRRVPRSVGFSQTLRE